MKSTWDNNDSSTRRCLFWGCLLFVLGIGMVGYCGHMEQYLGELQPDLVKFSGWVTTIAGLVLFLLGILQSPIRRRRTQ